MTGFDVKLVELINGNVITIGVVLSFLKGLAKITPHAWDDSIVSLFAGIFDKLNPTKQAPKEPK